MPRHKKNFRREFDRTAILGLSPISEEPERNLSIARLKRKAEAMGGKPFSPSNRLLSPFKSLKLSPIRSSNSQNVSMGTARRVPIHCVGDYSDSTTSSSEGDMSSFLNGSRRNMSWSVLEKTKSMQSFKGQMKLACYVNYGLLTVHIVQGKHLKSKSRQPCDSFVRVSLSPDQTQRTQCTTDVNYESNSPLYDEKFSFELLDEDSRKRLLISVWNKHKDGVEFVGCMSFGVKHILSEQRPINGWYYLLSDEVGVNKHLQCNSKKEKLKERSQNSMPNVNQDVHWMDTHVLLIKKGKNGFGFIVTGNAPVQVCRVESGSTSERCGLRKDDYIARIDGLNVSRSTADSVARIISHADKHIVVEIQRSTVLPSTEKLSQSLLEKHAASTSFSEKEKKNSSLSRKPSRRDRVKQIFKIYKERKANQENKKALKKAGKHKSSNTSLTNVSSLDSSMGGARKHKYSNISLTSVSSLDTSIFTRSFKDFS